MTLKYQQLPPCTLLPLAARMQLIKASEISDDAERARETNATVKRLKMSYPEYFRQEIQNDH